MSLTVRLQSADAILARVAGPVAASASATARARVALLLRENGAAAVEAALQAAWAAAPHIEAASILATETVTTTLVSADEAKLLAFEVEQRAAKKDDK